MNVEERRTQNCSLVTLLVWMGRMDRMEMHLLTVGFEYPLLRNLRQYPIHTTTAGRNGPRPHLNDYERLVAQQRHQELQQSCRNMFPAQRQLRTFSDHFTTQV